MKNTTINLWGVKKSFKNQLVLNNISFDVKENDFIVLTGNSGSGKTTLINIICMLEVVDSGAYCLFNNDVDKLHRIEKSELRRNVFNIVFQKYNLFEELTLYENLITYLEICGFTKEVGNERIEKMAKELNIQAHINKCVSVLSHGEKQRVAVARCFLTDKKIIIADEPTASVDKDNRDIIISMLKKAHSDGKTIIVATHEPEYLKVSTRNINISYGEIQEKQ